MTHANAAMPDAATARSSGGLGGIPRPRAVERAGGLLVLAPYPHPVGNRRADPGDEGRRLPIVPDPDEAVVPAGPVPVGRLPGHVPSRRRRGRLPGMMIGIYDEYNWLSGAIRLGGLLHAGQCADGADHVVGRQPLLSRDRSARATVWRGAGCSRRRCFARCAGGMISTVCWPETRGARWRLAKADMPRYACRSVAEADGVPGGRIRPGTLP